jgi:hypothetical protein
MEVETTAIPTLLAISSADIQSIHTLPEQLDAAVLPPSLKVGPCLCAASCYVLQDFFSANKELALLPYTAVAVCLQISPASLMVAPQTDELRDKRRAGKWRAAWTAYVSCHRCTICRYG